MRARTTLTASAIAAAAALLLTGCGGGSPSSDKIAGAQGPASTSPSAPSSSAANRPTFTFPADVKYVFEGGPTGEPVKDQILSDNEQRIKSLDYAVVTNNPKSPGLSFYSSGAALASGYQVVKEQLDAGYTITGTSRYYDLDVVSVSGNSAVVSYCTDQSQVFSKIRSTGKVLTTPATSDAYVLYNVRMQKDQAGVWQTTFVNSFQGDKKCQP
jgi:hypothetical protein